MWPSVKNDVLIISSGHHRFWSPFSAHSSYASCTSQSKQLKGQTTKCADSSRLSQSTEAMALRRPGSEPPSLVPFPSDCYAHPGQQHFI